MAAGEAVAEPMVAVAPAATTEAGAGPDRAATRVVGEAEVARRVHPVRQGSTVAAEGLAMVAEVGRPVRPAEDPAMVAEVGRPARRRRALPWWRRWAAGPPGGGPPGPPGAPGGGGGGAACATGVGAVTMIEAMATAAANDVQRGLSILSPRVR